MKDLLVEPGADVELDAAVFVRNLSVATLEGQTLLDSLSFALPAGQLTVIVGASGCGKTTLLRALAGLNPDHTGHILLDGHPIEEMRQAYPRTLGYLPQFTACHAHLTVQEILDDACSLRLSTAIGRMRRDAWCRQLIKLTGTEPLLNQTYQTLSGGQRRRVALLEVLVGNPTFLFLDELTTGLDALGDFEIMACLRDLALSLRKNIILVTHNVENLHLSHNVLLLHQGRLCFQGSYEEMLLAHQTDSMVALFGLYQEATRQGQFDESSAPILELPGPPEVQPIRQPAPADTSHQFVALVRRQFRLLFRDRVQLSLHLALIITFPLLVIIFGLQGLPQVRILSLSLVSNPVHTLSEQLDYFNQSVQSATLISGLTMFQVILLTLMGCNNGAREIAKEQALLAKELRAGLSGPAYVAAKFVPIVLLCFLQAAWMAWFVKSICGFPGSLASQFLILFLVSLAMSTACLAISAACVTEERASLLGIYLVGLQLPLSGAVLALPTLLSQLFQPVIAAYWGWSGYVKTLSDSRYYDMVHQSTHTTIADYRLAVAVLLAQTVIALGLTVHQVKNR